MGTTLSQDRVRSIIDVQAEIAATDQDAHQVMAVVAARAREVAGADAALVELLEAGQMVYHAGSGAATGFIGLRLDSATGAGQRTRRDEVLYCRDARDDRRLDREAATRAGVASVISVPVTHRGRVLGAVKLYSRSPDAFEEEDVRVVQLLAGLMAPHVAHWQESERRVKETMVDPLTGLPNRRAFEARLGSEVARVRRHGGRLSLCLLDIDQFREVNETLGRVVGDEVLRGVAQNLILVRGEDEPFRLDRDEFALIFSGVDSEGAEVAATRLAAAVISDRGCGGVTVSWGVATLNGGDPVALLGAAEEALEEAKRAGSL